MHACAPRFGSFRRGTSKEKTSLGGTRYHGQSGETSMEEIRGTGRATPRFGAVLHASKCQDWRKDVIFARREHITIEPIRSELCPPSRAPLQEFFWLFSRWFAFVPSPIPIPDVWTCHTKRKDQVTIIDFIAQLPPSELSCIIVTLC
jgi:hypothetical protein